MLTWDYFDKSGAASSDAFGDEPSAERIIREINGYTVADGRPLRSFAELKDDGSTAAGAWIYTGIYAPTEQSPEVQNRAASRQGDE